MQAVKMVITGPFAAGKTAFIGAVSEIDVVRTERKISSSAELYSYRGLDNHAYYRLMDDEPMPIRDKGPLFIVYPFDSQSLLRSERYYSRSAWQLRTLDVK